MKKSFIVLIFINLLFSSCKKEENTVDEVTPTPTPTTNFKISCTVDGVAWGTDSTLNQYLFETSGDYRELVCVGYDNNRTVSFAWGSLGVTSMAINTDTLSVPTEGIVLYEGYKNGVYLEDYLPINGKLLFTAYDSVAQTVSGIFESVLVEPNVNDTVVLKNGKFTGLHFDKIIL